MKYTFVLLAVLAASTSATAAPAKRPAAAMTPAPGKTARIDPQALALLARVAEKYSNSVSYQAESESSFSLNSRPAPDKSSYRLYVSAVGDLDLVLTQKGVTARALSDGKQLLTTRSDQPKRYRLEKVPYSHPQRDAVLLLSHLEGFVADALTRRLGNLLLNPQLQSVSLGKSRVQSGVPLRPIEFVQYNGTGKNRERSIITLEIGPDETIRSAQARSAGSRGDKWLWSERHRNIRFGIGMARSVKVVPPAGFTRDESK